MFLFWKLRFEFQFKINTGEKPSKCTQCDRSFSWNCTVKIHLRIHTGEKPSKCILCYRSLSWNCTVKYILEYTLVRNHLNVPFVTGVSRGIVLLNYILEYTLVRNHLIAPCVTGVFHGIVLCIDYSSVFSIQLCVFLMN